MARESEFEGATSDPVAASRLGARSLPASLFACAWMLTIALPAAAQEANEPTAEEAPTAVPAESEPPPADSAAAIEDPDAPLPTETTEPAPVADSSPERSLQEVVVTGYRRSLGAALASKKRATAQVDAIVAEDIADFPDLNLAESLQRIAGVSITRDAGEGARITVRGLSGQYTRTRINGMDTRAGVGENSTREFDFNLFASELFNSITVHKTASPELGDGSLGSVIDLNTGRAFAFKKGFSFVLGAQGALNDLSLTLRPRVAGLVAYHDPGGIFGATASVAYSQTRNDQTTSDTGRWAKSLFRSVKREGDPAPEVCDLAKGAVNTGQCEVVEDAFHARIPRYLDSMVSSERIGVTAGLQFRPIKQTEIRLDGLYARFNRRNETKMIEVLFRSNEAGMDITDYDVRTLPDRLSKAGVPMTNNTLTALSVDKTWVRSESYLYRSESDFYQLTLAVDQEFTDRFYAKAIAGMSVSKGHLPQSTALMYDDRAYDGYRYDYGRSSTLPYIAYNGRDVTDPAIFTLTELRDQEHTTKNIFETAELKLYFEAVDWLRLVTGFTFKRLRHDTEQSQRDGGTCALKRADGTPFFNCDTDGDGKNDILGPSGEVATSSLTEYRGAVGAGSTTRWATPSVDAWADRLGYYDVPLKPDYSRTREVEESNLGGFLQLDGEVPLGGGMRLNYNGGVQYVETRQKSVGWASSGKDAQGKDLWNEVKDTRPVYRDWLPSANLAFWPSDSIAIRFAASKVMARPVLSTLAPGGSVDSFNYRINFTNTRLDPTRALALDASAEWYFAKDSALGLALFRKDIESFPLPATKKGFFRDQNLPLAVISPTSPASQDLEGATCVDPEGCWEITRIENGPGSVINGLELGFQAPLSSFSANLPPVIRGLGFIGNVTLVDSKTNYESTLFKVTERLLDLSRYSFNGTLYYEDSKFGARLSVANRSDYLQSGPDANASLWQFMNSSTRFDFSSSYQVLDQLEVSFEALNLTNTPIHNMVDVDARRPLVHARNGRTYLLGARYSY